MFLYFRKHKNILILLGILLLALLLRLYNTANLFPITDEIKDVLNVDWPHPPLIISMFFYSQVLFSFKLIFPRLVSVAFGVISCLIVYFLGKEIKDEKLGLLMAFFLTILPSNVLISRTMWVEGGMLVFWLLAILFFLKLEKIAAAESKTWLEIGFVLSIVASTFSKNQSVVLIPIFFSWFFFKYFFVFFEKNAIIQSARKIFLAMLTDKTLWLFTLAEIPYVIYLLSRPEKIYAMFIWGGNELATTTISSRMLVFLLRNWQFNYWIFVLAMAGALVYIFRMKRFPLHYLFFLIFLAWLFIYFLTVSMSFYNTIWFEVPIVFFLAFATGLIPNPKWQKVYLAYIVLAASMSVIFNQYYYHDFYAATQPKVWQTRQGEIRNFLAGEKNVILYSQAGWAPKYFLRQVAWQPAVIYSNKLDDIQYALIDGETEQYHEEVKWIKENWKLAKEIDSIKIYKK